MSFTDPRGFLTEAQSIVEIAPNPQAVRMHCVEMAVRHYADAAKANPDGVMKLAERMWTFVRGGP